MFIIDYAGKRTDLDFELEDESIFNAWIDVFTGDEILNVIRKNGEHETYDSSDDRCTDCYDGRYYLVKNGKICLNSYQLERFKHREDSYECMFLLCG